ncbi:hypothetical protein CCR85_11025 [Rhodothalassium salexigens]|nr:hypothetical protein [Rhodothalassium salexigens]
MPTAPRATIWTSSTSPTPATRRASPWSWRWSRPARPSLRWRWSRPWRMTTPGRAAWRSWPACWTRRIALIQGRAGRHTRSLREDRMTGFTRLTAALGAATALLCAAPALAQAPQQAPDQTADGVEVSVPEGFTITPVAQGLGCVRHIAVHEDGTIYGAMMRRSCAAGDGGLVVLRDPDGDGTHEATFTGADIQGTGIALYRGRLYYGTDTAIRRYTLDPDTGLPAGAGEVIVGGFDEQSQHAVKPIAFDAQGHLYVSVGAPSNACQERMRTPGSPGLDPCPQLDRAGGIWRYDAQATGQRHSTDRRFATGTRNAMGLAYHPGADRLFFASHGRDDLHRLFPDLYTVEQNAELPSEEVHRLVEGGDYGWPYTYYDHEKGRRMVAPEYGGDGEKAAEPGRYAEPVATIPGHWAPNDLIVYTAQAFPERYRGGLFIAYHGSWNRAPLPQRGYNVVFVPVSADGGRVGEPEVFADGFKGREPLRSPRNAAHRPTGLAVGPDGALYVADDQGGTIWRIAYDR